MCVSAWCVHFLSVSSQGWFLRRGIYNGVQLKSKPHPLESDQPQHDRPGACVVAQQYSSATFVSLRFQLPHGKNLAHFFKNIIICTFFTFLLIA
jgi:hypothetical protein